MKTKKKISALFLSLIMILSLSIAALAQDVIPENVDNQGSGSITVQNAAKGEEYKLYRLFDATVSEKADSIAYTGTIPESLNEFFSADSNGYITPTDAAWKDPAAENKEMSEDLKTALKEWAETSGVKPVATAVGDGTALVFKSLKYGYYVMTSTQDGGKAITVDSTNPNAVVVDKNSTGPNSLVKKVDNDNVKIGDTVTYTVTFNTSNYVGSGTDAKKVVSYTITDTWKDFLTDVNVTSITVKGKDGSDKPITVGDSAQTPQFTKVQKEDGTTENKIVLDWCDKDGNFLYDNGATITITYTATVTDKAAIDGAGNTNTVMLQWTTENSSEPEEDNLTAEDTIYTYAFALKKVNEKGETLEGATFQLPFFVKKTTDTDGAYVYAGTTDGTDLTKTVTTPKNGLIIVKGLKAGEQQEITEVKAPDGYNILAEAIKVTPVKTGETTTKTTIYLNADGSVASEHTETTIDVSFDISEIAATPVAVLNKTGIELPSTGGTGTVIFYVLGSILLLGAAIFFVVRKRMSVEE